MIFRHLLNMRSHPTWVRGLKPQRVEVDELCTVAPYVGAWIETLRVTTCGCGGVVAPYVGAWIETSNSPCAFL